jgi:hypothetical protein
MTEKKLVHVDVSKVQSVYSGRDGRCCCGCSGTHKTASAFRAAHSKSRGYPVRDEEVSDRSVKLICNKINAAGGGEECSNHYFAVVGDRLYIAYKAEG